MKKIIFFIALIMNSYQLFSQSDSIYYVILTSKPYTEEEYRTANVILEGIYKTPPREDSLYNSPSFHFNIVSSERKINETFSHYDYNLEELIISRSKHSGEATISPLDIMKKKVMPIAFLDSISVIDLDKEFPTMTYERAEELLEPLRGRKIYVIDRNDMTDKTVTLIGVLYRTYRPAQIPFD